MTGVVGVVIAGVEGVAGVVGVVIVGVVGVAVVIGGGGLSGTITGVPVVGVGFTIGMASSWVLDIEGGYITSGIF